MDKREALLEDKPLLEVRELKTHFYGKNYVIPAVDGVSFSIGKAETLGIVGESGCGKSVTCLSIMRLIPQPPGRIVGGEIIFEGKDILKKTKAEMRDVRGKFISMVFQDPLTSLNPVFSIGDQIMEAITLHQKVNRAEARMRTIEILDKVGIPLPEKRMREYPHQMSGGMRQRIMIAMALSCNPKLLIADEPSTALDVTIQAQILDLMKRLQNELGMAIILITHDLGVVAEVVNKIIIMYGGKIVEEGSTLTIFKNPQHPYTLGLIESIPKLNEERDKLQVIEGNVPNPFDMPSGCHFHPRCSRVQKICSQEEPRLVEIEPGHKVACWRIESA